ncbi:MAG: cell division protein SepF [Erysipelotrichaceae bacterium]|nr:cell division protein SepF [Erysipelotrichaceae bacterium]
MGLFETIKNWFIEEETDERYEDGEENDPYQLDFQDSAAKKDIKAFIIVVKPFTFKDVEMVCKHLKRGRAVLLNTENMADEDKRRLIDFLSGVIMAMDGMIAKIYQNVFVCAPKDIGVIEE